MSKVKNNLLSKEEFVNIINELKKEWDFEEQVGDVFYSFGCMAPEFPSSYETVIKLLNLIFGIETDKNWNGDIDYFCTELDFGRNYQPGCVTENGNEIDLSTVEKLYDYITGGIRNGEEK